MLFTDNASSPREPAFQFRARASRARAARRRRAEGLKANSFRRQETRIAVVLLKQPDPSAFRDPSPSARDRSRRHPRHREVETIRWCLVRESPRKTAPAPPRCRSRECKGRECKGRECKTKTGIRCHVDTPIITRPTRCHLQSPNPEPRTPNRSVWTPTRARAFRWAPTPTRVSTPGGPMTFLAGARQVRTRRPVPRRSCPVHAP